MAQFPAWAWAVVAASCAFVTIDPWLILYGTLYTLFGTIGFLCAIFVIGSSKRSLKYFGVTGNARLGRTAKGMPQVMCALSSVTNSKGDKRLTGASIIDTLLQQVIDYSFRDFIEFWYYDFSKDPHFIFHTRQTVSTAIIRFAGRAKEMDVVTLFSVNYVDEFINHLRCFRKAQERVAATELKRSTDDLTAKGGEDPYEREIAERFFEMEKQHAAVCMSEEAEKAYLEDLSEVLLFLLLPADDFRNKPLRYMVRELLVSKVFMPVVEMLADPDYINQTIDMWIPQSVLTHETLMKTIKMCVTPDDLIVIYEKINRELAELDVHFQAAYGARRGSEASASGVGVADEVAADAEHLMPTSALGGDDALTPGGAKVGGATGAGAGAGGTMTDQGRKQHRLRCLSARRLCERRLAEFNRTDVICPLPGQSRDPQSLPQRTSSLTLDFVLTNSIAITYFMEYLESTKELLDLHFWLTVEMFRTTSYLRGKRPIDTTASGPGPGAPGQNLPASPSVGGSSITSASFHSVTSMRSSRDSSLMTALGEGDTSAEAVAAAAVSGNVQLSADVPSGNTGLNIEADPEYDDSLRTEALRIYDLYMGESASPRINLGDKVCAHVYQRIMKSPSPNAFDSAVSKVYDRLMKHFRKFRRSQNCTRLINDLDLIDRAIESDEEASDDHLEDGASGDDIVGPLLRGENAETASLLPSKRISLDERASQAPLGRPSIVAAHGEDAESVAWGASMRSMEIRGDVAVYIMEVRREDGTGVLQWTIARRYSDFHDLHMQLQKKFPNIGDFAELPPKRAFKNLSKTFLENRRQALALYLSQLLSPAVISRSRKIEDLIGSFLSYGAYEKEYGGIARKMDSIVNPIVSGVKSVGHKIRDIGEDIESVFKADGVQGGSREHSAGAGGTGRTRSGRTGSVLEDWKTTANFDMEEDENIPFRVLLALLDEILELKSRNKWLRRRVMALIRQVITQTFGDTINRKIVESVDYYTSYEQIAYYITQYRDSMWPGGVLGPPYVPRTPEAKLHTKLDAKAKILGSMPDDLKRVVGGENCRRSGLRIFDMLQQRRLNKRLVYCMLESTLQRLFPAVNFGDIIKRLHAGRKKKAY